MARIALTGADGNVGRELVDAFDDHDLRAFTHSETEGIDSELIDITDTEAVQSKLDDVDSVIHLADASSTNADWEVVSETNI